MKSPLFRLQLSDLQKAFIMSVIAGAMLPVAAILQTPGFSVATANWKGIIILALNGAVVGFVSYLVKNFFTDSTGKFAGKADKTVAQA